VTASPCHCGRSRLLNNIRVYVLDVAAQEGLNFIVDDHLLDDSHTANITKWHCVRLAGFVEGHVVEVRRGGIFGQVLKLLANVIFRGIVRRIRNFGLRRRGDAQGADLRLVE